MAGDTSRSETRQGGSGRPRRRCLGDDQGVENASLPLSKRGRPARSDLPTFSGFAGIYNDLGSVRRNDLNESTTTCNLLKNLTAHIISRGG